MSIDDTNSGKRTRASGEVLDYLLEEFDHNHNPSAEQRKEISDKTNMTEKAVRIWFQNRRAKLRKSERQVKSGPQDMNPGHNRSNSTNVNYQTNYPKNFSINENYCFINCSSLSVGSWQRVRAGELLETVLKSELVNLSPFTMVKIMENIDLLVILLKKNLEINYFFSAMAQKSKILFRIFYPLSNILTCSLLDNNINKENSELRVNLSHQPNFSVNFFNGANRSSNQWSICEDFSEGQQVSTAHADGGKPIPHVLVGIKASICALNDFILESTQRQPGYLVNTHTNGVSVSSNNSDGDVHDEMYNEKDEMKPTITPLVQFGTDNSTTTDKKISDVQQNLPYSGMFLVNTPDFLTSSHPANIVPSIDPHNENVSPISRPNVSQYHNIANQENYEGTTDQFDFPVVDGYSEQDQLNAQSPVDTFIDYSHDYP